MAANIPVPPVQQNPPPPAQPPANQQPQQNGQQNRRTGMRGVARFFWRWIRRIVLFFGIPIFILWVLGYTHIYTDFDSLGNDITHLDVAIPEAWDRITESVANVIDPGHSAREQREPQVGDPGCYVISVDGQLKCAENPPTPSQ